MNILYIATAGYDFYSDVVVSGTVTIVTCGPDIYGQEVGELVISTYEIKPNMKVTDETDPCDLKE